MDDCLRHGSRYLYPKDDPNSIALRLYSLTDYAGRRIKVAFDTNASGSSTGMLTSARSNQAYTTGASPDMAAYQQSDYTYGLAGGNSTASHKWLQWLQRLRTTWNYKGWV